MSTAQASKVRSPHRSHISGRRYSRRANLDSMLHGRTLAIARLLGCKRRVLAEEMSR